MKNFDFAIFISSIDIWARMFVFSFLRLYLFEEISDELNPHLASKQLFIKNLLTTITNGENCIHRDIYYLSSELFVISEIAQ